MLVKCLLFELGASDDDPAPAPQPKTHCKVGAVSFSWGVKNETPCNCCHGKCVCHSHDNLDDHCCFECHSSWQQCSLTQTAKAAAYAAPKHCKLVKPELDEVLPMCKSSPVQSSRQWSLPRQQVLQALLQELRSMTPVLSCIVGWVVSCPT